MSTVAVEEKYTEQTVRNMERKVGVKSTLPDPTVEFSVLLVKRAQNSIRSPINEYCMSTDVSDPFPICM